MPTNENNDQLLSGIIVYGFSLAFGLLIASLEALRPTLTGFTIQFSGSTVVALLAGAAAMVPFFYAIVYSRRKYLRRGALAFVVVIGLGAFLYPMRVVPVEKLHAVFIGLAVAIGALSVMATLLFLLHRFFEKEERR